MSAVKTIVITNHREFMPHIDPYFPPEEFEYIRWLDFDHEPVGFFWGGDEKLVITSFPLDEQFVADNCRAMNFHSVRVVSPVFSNDWICENIQNDPVVFADLVQTIRDSDCPQILVWAASPPYYRLMERLAGLGLSFLPARVPPEAAYWTLTDFGSKVGFHRLGDALAKIHPQVKLPEALICDTLPEAFEKAQYFAVSNRPFLMKTNQGSAGWGTLVFNPASSLNNPSKEQIEESHSGIWASGPVVIEEYIESGFRPSTNDQFPLIPTVDMLITPSGEVQFQFVGNMIIENLTQYHGVALGQGVLPPEIENKLKEIGMIFGTALSERGYRGWFDVDFVTNANQELYCNEINTRTTGPVHAFDIFMHLKEQHVEINTILANDSWMVAAFDGYSYAQVKAVFQEVLYPMTGQPRGLILTLVTSHGEIGFAIVGQDFADVIRIKHQAEALAETVR